MRDHRALSGWTTVATDHVGQVLVYVTDCLCGIPRWDDGRGYPQGADADCGIDQRQRASLLIEAYRYAHALRPDMEMEWQGNTLTNYDTSPLYMLASVLHSEATGQRMTRLARITQQPRCNGSAEHIHRPLPPSLSLTFSWLLGVAADTSLRLPHCLAAYHLRRVHSAENSAEYRIQ